MDQIFSNPRLEGLLWKLLDECHLRDRGYVYRLLDSIPIKPALFKGELFPDLLNYLRDAHGGGHFRLLIRRGEKMMLAGMIGIEASKGRRT